MKVASYILFVLAGIACALIAASFFVSDFRARISAWKTGGVVVTETQTTSGAVSSGASEEAFQRIHALEEQIQALQTKIEQIDVRLMDAEGGLVETTKSLSGSTPAAAPIAVPPFIALKLSSASFTPLAQKDLFGLSLFSGLQFTGYTERQLGAKWYFFNETYETVKKNLSAVTALQIKETGAFFGKSFFVNLKPQDNMVRVVFVLNDKAVAVEVVKLQYEALKKLLLK